MLNQLISSMFKFKTAYAIALCSAVTLCMSTLSVDAKTPTFKHVVLITSDGFSAEVMAANPGKFPNIEKLFGRGYHTLEARSVLPSSSAINWATLLMGAGSEMHGFTEWGSKTPEVKPAYIGKYGMFPGIFGEVRQQIPDAKTGVFYSWDGIGYVFEKEAVDVNSPTNDDDCLTAQNAVEFITESKPTLAFICFAEPDHAGHSKGWMSPDYVKACQKIDSLVGVVVACVDTQLDPKSTAIIYTSDHGGIGTGHGAKTMNEMQVPYVMVGRNIPQDKKIDRIVMKYDNAPTIADMLGIKSPEQWRGRSVVEGL